MPVISRPFATPEPAQLEGVSTFAESLQASIGEAFETGPMAGLLTAADLAEAETGDAAEASRMFMATRVGGPALFAPKPLSPMLTPEDAQQKVKDAGLEGQIPLGNYPSGIRQKTLDILISKNQDKVRRQTVMAEYDGWSPQVAGMVIGSVIDPANVALSFVPVVGEARYAQLLARAPGALGRAGVRAGVGAVEGLAGAAIAEPFIYYGQQQWRNDYDAYDSMLNVAGGALFGSLLHAGAGLVRDTFGQPVVPPELEAEVRDLREAIAREAESRLATTPDPAARAMPGAWMRPMDLDRADIEARLRERPVDEVSATTAAFERLRPDIEADLLGRTSGVAEPGVVAAARQDLAAAQYELDGLEGQRRDIIKAWNDQPGVTRKRAERLADEQIADRRADLEGRVRRAQDQIQANKDGGEAVAELSALRKTGEVPASWRDRIQLEARRMMDPDAVAPRPSEADPFAGVRPFIATLDQGTQASSLRQAVAQALGGQPIDVTPAMLADPMFQASPLAYRTALDRAAANADQIDGANETASRSAQEQLAQARPSDQLQQAQEQLDAEIARLRERGAELEDLDEDDLKLTTDAVKAATFCLMRTAG